MPRSGPRRPQVAVRLSEQGITALDALAADTGSTRSDVIRALLGAALADQRTTAAAKRALRA